MSGRETYQALEFEVIEFDHDDIVTASKDTDLPWEEIENPN